MLARDAKVKQMANLPGKYFVPFFLLVKPKQK